MERDDEWNLARIREGGVAAQAVLDGELANPGATVSELHVLVAEGKQAEEKLIAAHLPYAQALAIQAALRHGISRDDARQEAAMGIVLAVQRYDYRREMRFSTYASYWVRNRIFEVLATRAGSDIVPARLARDAVRVRMELGRRESQQLTCDIEALADSLGMSRGRVADIVTMRRTCEFTEEIAQAEEEQVDVVPLLAGLDAQMLQALRMRFGFDGRRWGLRAIARELGMPERELRRRMNTTLAQLRADAMEHLAA